MSEATDQWKTTDGLLTLLQLPGVGPAKAIAAARGETDITSLASGEELDEARARARETSAACRASDIRTIGFFDEEFPSALRSIHAFPAVLYLRGSASAWTPPGLGVVGTREPSNFGETATRELTLLAARAGLAIISGLALGIDGIAHRAALEAGGRTVAVLGSGLDAISPRQHSELASEITRAGGALISEQPPGVQPSARTLVARNRLQSALSLALLVGQTGTKGGTLHTVRFAAEQGRPVFCPQPHQPHPASAGLYALLDRPANELPRLLPAWDKYQRLADRLGSRPLAQAVTADSAEQWVARLMRGSEGGRDISSSIDTSGASNSSRSDSPLGQLTFDTLV